MRELKFRAWDKTEKKMLFGADPFVIDVWGDNESIFAEPHKRENCIFEQYTGLKDKNGKEIYEGDIVKLTGKVAANKCSVYKVGWDGFLVAFDLFPLERNKSDIGYLNEVEAHRYNVIGNIHENPELIKEEE